MPGARKPWTWSTVYSTPQRQTMLGLALLCFIIAVWGLQVQYAWQIILLQQVLPPGRTACPVAMRHTPGRRDTPLRFGILLLFDDGMWSSQLSQDSLENKRQYAQRHGYDLVVARGKDIDRSRPAAWSKFKAMRKHLPRYDYLLYTDADTIVMNQEVKLESLVGDGSADVIITEDWNGVNTGVFMLRNSTWTYWFLREAWGLQGSEQEHMALHDRSAGGMKYPFEYEQRAVHYLLQTEIWTERHLPRYRPAITFEGALQTSETMWRHVQLLPQCALNSYMLYPSFFRRGYVSAQWVAGDFVVHMAGHKGSNKQQLFRYCFRMSQQAMTTRIDPRLKQRGRVLHHLRRLGHDRRG
uniref:Nucleotide-diphospho-sugar transferase domain-containing protein n=1 Tax=Rhizochromulina marina TaxID=1034831 RepID=A0A7S2WUX7_9STRA|mmetsp:Transcript_5282/g.15503  ORF Transcript_5282/g.15503 Transcript_5282/m.15503 type:complete len:354 (+) Transcript_5282:132-1193(+)|eukprot:CAMPEP_0118998052 /NCGR_PEP_ID=MMETSP1173-20130426/62781_1 /TAXON_ID=1034831 /ORGANISM="Rhizochromulina marina cf, Strain CCMP1243" /LENGTH=353 /DNA_ID=CAMNT_0006949529 /DNA_START=99 /DNA_END=1160 /DNA_ORIENTATION=-